MSLAVDELSSTNCHFLALAKSCHGCELSVNVLLVDELSSHQQHMLLRRFRFSQKILDLAKNLAAEKI